MKFRNRRIDWCSGIPAIFLCIGVVGSTHAVATQQSTKQTTPPVRDEKKTLPRRKPVVPDYSKFELEDPSKLKSEPMQIGATRGGPGTKAIPLAPRLGKVYGLQ